MAAVDAGAARAGASRGSDDDLGTHSLAIVSFLYNRVIAGAAPALRKHVGLSVTEARVVFHLGATAMTTANKLAKGLGLDKAAISRAINRLIELDLISSQRDPSHASRNLLVLTERGQASFKLIENFTYERERHLLSVLTEDEQQQLLANLRKILTNVDSVNKLVAEGRFWD